MSAPQIGSSTEFAFKVNRPLRGGNVGSQNGSLLGGFPKKPPRRLKDAWKGNRRPLIMSTLIMIIPTAIIPIATTILTRTIMSAAGMAQPRDGTFYGF